MSETELFESPLGGWLVKFFQSLPFGAIRGNERFVAELSGLNADEVKVGLYVLRKVGIVKRFRDPNTRLQYLVLDPELCPGETKMSAEYFAVSLSSNERRYCDAVRKAACRLSKSPSFKSHLFKESLRAY